MVTVRVHKNELEMTSIHKNSRMRLSNGYISNDLDGPLMWFSTSRHFEVKYQKNGAS